MKEEEKLHNTCPSVCSHGASIPQIHATVLMAFLFFSFFAPAVSGAAIYRYFGADGSIHFTDTPGRGAVEVVADSAAARAMSRKKAGGFCPVSRVDKDPHIDALIKSMSRKYGVDPSLVKAVISAESGYNRMAVSPKGAMGLMQLMPGTANSLGVFDPFDPQQNIEGGVRYLSSLLERYGGNVTLALAAYNAGPGSVEKYGCVPPYQETDTYVRKVLAAYDGPSRPALKGHFRMLQKKKNKRASFVRRKNTIIYKVTLNDGTVLYTNNPSSGF